MVAPNKEYIEFELRLVARSVMSEMAKLANATMSYEQRIVAVRQNIKKLSQESGHAFATLKKHLMDADRALAGKGSGSALFGNQGKQAWAQIGDAADAGSKKVAKSFDVMRMTGSLFLYDLIGNVLQGVTQFFTSAIDQAMQMEDTLWRLANAERAISKGGGDVTFAGLKQGIKDIKELTPIFAEEDIAQMMGAIAVSTKELGLSEKQIRDLAKAAAVFNVQSTESETLLQSQSKLVNALVSPQSKSIKEYALAFSQVTMKAKGLEMGILGVGDSVSKLTDKQKAQIKLAIMLDTAASSAETLGDYMDSNTAKLQKNAAAWKDLKTTIGQVLLPFIPALTMLMTAIDGGFQGAKVVVSEFLAALGTVIAVVIQFAANVASNWKNLLTFNWGEIKNPFSGLKELFLRAWKEIRAAWIKDFFPEIPSNAPEWFKKLYSHMIPQGAETDTANIVPDVSDAVEKEAVDTEKEMEKLRDIMQENADKLVDINKDYQQKIEDINRDYARKQQDISVKATRDRADAEKDYADKVADINRDVNEAKAEAQQEYYKSEQEAEQEHQDKLQELREQYLMDLEEALHERDARQILRLMRQYQIDKQNANKEREQKRQEAQQELQQKLAEAETERQEKLAAAKKELEDKLEQNRLARAREREDARRAHEQALQDARINYQRQLADQRTFLQRKLRDLAQAIAEEYNMSMAGATAIVNGLMAAYGAASGMASSINNPSNNQGQFTSYTPLASPTWGTYGAGGSGGLAEGGTFLATRPATINVGENRPEVITATPLGKPGRDLDKLFTNATGQGSGGGMMEVAITLSPDLEGRIVRKTLDETANVVMRVNRSKV